MKTLERIAHFQNRRDEVPNQELAQDLATHKDRKGIREIADNLWNKNAQVQSDCLKVLYEIGYLEPTLITDYCDDFIKLLGHKNNRLVWGSMIALSTIAGLMDSKLFKYRDLIWETMKRGSVITVDNGIKTLSVIAAKDPRRGSIIFNELLKHLQTCRSKEIPQHSEKILVAVTATNSARFVQVLESRFSELTPAQSTRVRRIIKRAQNTTS